MQTQPGDIVLIHHQNNPVVYARVEEITADVKPGWWHLRLLVLQVPSREVVWILRDEYIDGAEFTMDGEAMRLEPLGPPAAASAAPAVPTDAEPSPAGGETPSDQTGPAAEDDKVVDLAERRKGKP
jgi:hypothetical protein